MGARSEARWWCPSGVVGGVARLGEVVGEVQLLGIKRKDAA